MLGHLRCRFTFSLEKMVKVLIMYTSNFEPLAYVWLAKTLIAGPTARVSDSRA